MQSFQLIFLDFQQIKKAETNNFTFLNSRQYTLNLLYWRKVLSIRGFLQLFVKKKEAYTVSKSKYPEGI